MKYTDNILQYLSGDMDRKTSEAFEQEMNANDHLREEFTIIQNIWHILQEKLQMEGLSEGLSREAMIAEIIAEHDLLRYKDRKAVAKEEDFSNTLKSVIEKNKKSAGIAKEKKHPGQRRLYLIAMVAAAALLLLLLLPGPSFSSLVAGYYDPTEILKPLNSVSAARNAVPGANLLFMNGAYSQARRYFEKELDQLDPEELLMYAISCHETGDDDTSISVLKDLIKDMKVSYDAKWVLSLIYLKIEKPAQAKEILEELASTQGTYKQKAKRLLRNWE